MSHYTDAPATQKLNAHCARCARPLLDAESVTVGLGPVCRKLWAYDQILDEDVRKAANVLIHEAGAYETTNARRLEIAEEMLVLGHGTVKLALAIRDKFIVAAVTLTLEDVTFGRGHYAETVEAIVVDVAFNRAFTDAFKAAVDWRDRTVLKGDDDRFRAWAIKPEAKGALWAVCKAVFGGEFLKTPDERVVEIPAAERRAA